MRVSRYAGGTSRHSTTHNCTVASRLFSFHPVLYLLPPLRSRLRVSFGPRCRCRSRDHESWTNPLPAPGGRLSQSIMLKRVFLVSPCCLSRAAATCNVTTSSACFSTPACLHFVSPLLASLLSTLPPLPPTCTAAAAGPAVDAGTTGRMGASTHM